ncbi:MAG TPA: DF family (seleno)protein [Candidatus Tripitaka sp. YC43]
MKKLKIQLLHTESCHSYQEALVGIKEALKELGLSAELEVILVDSPEKARAYKFLGSPTIKINGIDLEAGRGDRPDAPTRRTTTNHLEASRWESGARALSSLGRA